jgi:hypothetical protein
MMLNNIEDCIMIGQLFTTGIGIYQQSPRTDNKWICYFLTKLFPKDELYGMVQQIRRSAVSIRC